MQLTWAVKKLFHFKREIADAKILHFDLGAKASLESPFDADVKVWYTRNATKYSFCAIGDLLAALGSENRPRHGHAHGSAIPGAIPQNGRKPA